ncbi:signal peptidase I [Streptomyces sp. NPDC058045]|uniref:signal peptidase I n=1 Tax=Streptomyces sp. NPDC058045 TaxID=3346311 RepID=UPI0036ECC9AC
MDLEAQHTERDRTPEPSPGEDSEERSRSVRSTRLTRHVPGGRITVVAVLCIGLVLLLGRFVLQPFAIPSSSMEPGIRPGDRVLVNKMAYGFGSVPQRGDVVVFDGTGYFGAGDYVKRVAGTGGDHIVCCDSQGRIEVNGRPQNEQQHLHPGDAPSTVRFDVRVPPDRLFVLGDHRSNSRDSRDLLGAPGGGMVPVDAVIGRARWIAWPVSRWGALPGGGHG